jgi:hypothetical protein
MYVMKANKSFKIGEYAVGGIIQVQLTGKVVVIKALDYTTKTPIKAGSTTTDTPGFERMINNYLNELTSYYYAEKIMGWITEKTGIKF